jgi:hypothetical protein
MSLFDDLLKQSTPVTTGQSGTGQAGGNPPQDDPLATTTNPIIISEATPMVSVQEIVQPEIEVPADTQMSVTESDNSIIIDESETASAVGDNMPAPSLIGETTPAADPVSTDTSSLFGMSDTIAATAVPSTPVASVDPEPSMSDLFETMASTPVATIVQKENEAEFHDTNTYIDHAIEEVSGLIAGIDAQDAMVLRAEEEHRKQKEHFAELEIADEATHQKHLEERAHAEKMKKYLEKEQGAALKKNEEKEVVTA